MSAASASPAVADTSEASTTSTGSSSVDTDQLRTLVEYFKAQTRVAWSLVDSLSAYTDARVVDLIRQTWDLYADQHYSPADERRIKSGLLVSLVGVPRKRRAACRQGAELVETLFSLRARSRSSRLLRKAADEKDVLIASFAKAIAPSMALDPKLQLGNSAKATWGPSLDVEFEKWCPPFAKALDDLTPTRAYEVELVEYSKATFVPGYSDKYVD
ncbi:hypothetical protein HK405_000068 [Cladochytrium tenue]|nr:hypothetical protein HK405_000068 [Cladochytrium tenue]